MIARFLISWLVCGAAFAAPCQMDLDQMAAARKYFAQKQFLLSGFHFSWVAANRCSEDLLGQANYGFALAMLELGESATALEALKKVPSAKTKSALGFYGLENTGDYRVDIWNARFGDIFDLVRGPDKESLLKLSAQMQSRPMRNPWIAGGLSVVPGLGQVYVGNYQSAAIAFILNSLFFAATLEFANQGLVTPAIASGLVFSVTYIGNIVNAAQSANQFTHAQRAEDEAQLKDLLFPELKP